MQPISTDDAPRAIGTYSQAIRYGELVFLSGQIPLNPHSMQLCSEEIEAQIIQVFDNLSAVCKSAGGQLADIAKLSVYLTDLSHFSLVNDVMSRYFKEPYPARAAIGVASLPRNALVEMDGIMILPRVQQGQTA